MMFNRQTASENRALLSPMAGKFAVKAFGEASSYQAVWPRNERESSNATILGTTLIFFLGRTAANTDNAPS
jgi:hypothetical protein